MVPETQEPVLQLIVTVSKRTGHEDPGSKVHHVGMELVDEGVEMMEKVWNPVH